MLFGNMADEFRGVPERQVEKLVDYLERYPSMATANVRNREGILRFQYMWEKIGINLNKLDDRVKKNGRDWAKFWFDWMHKIRHRYTQHQRLLAQGNVSNIEFSTHEQRMLKIITDREGNLLPFPATKDEDLDANHNNSIQREMTSPNDLDDIYIQHQEDSKKKSIEELRRELVEFELKKQKEIFEIEKKHKCEKHEMDLAILELRRQLLVKELEKT